MLMQIWGRRAGGADERALLIESDGVTSTARIADSEAIREFVVASARRSVDAFRAKGIEGYVLFEGDTKRYVFTPQAGFVYPARKS
jgi:hypothetical protein